MKMYSMPYFDTAKPLCICAILLSAFAGKAFNYPDFSSVSGLNLVGSASQQGSILRLTPALQSQAAATWYAQKQFVAGGFDTTFSFRISNPDTALGGGDGIAFILQNFNDTSPALEMGGVSNSFAVSFNTFNNFGDEPSGNFVGIVTNQYAPVNRYSHTYNLDLTPIRLEDGSIHTAQFHYDAAGLDLTLDGLSIFSNVAIPLDEGTDASGNSWVGFGARTGDAYENQDILSWSFQAIPEPSSITLGVFGLVLCGICRKPTGGPGNTV
jgi:hypothetical protein